MSFLQYEKCVSEGSTVIVYLNISHIYAISITRGDVFQTMYGALRHDDIIGKQYGSVVNCSRGWVYILFPTSELWTLTLPHRTQILYTPDISLVVLQLDLKPGCIVLEAGTGSGSLSHAIARTVAPSGHLYTFDFHEQRVKLAEEEFKAHGLSDIVTVAQRDVCIDGFGYSSIADGIFLDLPHPWEVIPFTLKGFKSTGGRFCSFSPCIEQVQKTCASLHSHGFTDITTVECILRPFEARHVSQPILNLSQTSNATCEEKERISVLSKEGHKKKSFRSVRNECETEECWTALPSLQMAGHTGYLTFASYGI